MAPDCGQGRGSETDILSAFLQKLREEEQHKRCHSAFCSLTGSEKCEATELMWHVANVKLAFEHHTRVQDEPYRMDATKLKTLVQKTLWVAGEWEKQFLTQFGKEVLRFSERLHFRNSQGEFLRLPQRLRLLASEAKAIHSGTRSQRRPLYDDALGTLTEYVRHKTGDYHDPEVACLVWWAIETKNYDENTLRVWRKQHRSAVDRARKRLSNH